MAKRKPLQFSMRRLLLVVTIICVEAALFSTLTNHYFGSQRGDIAAMMLVVVSVSTIASGIVLQAACRGDLGRCRNHCGYSADRSLRQSLLESPCPADPLYARISCSVCPRSGIMRRWKPNATAAGFSSQVTLKGIIGHAAIPSYTAASFLLCFGCPAPPCGDEPLNRDIEAALRADSPRTAARLFERLSQGLARRTGTVEAASVPGDRSGPHGKSCVGRWARKNSRLPSALTRLVCNGFSDSLKDVCRLRLHNCGEMSY